MKIDVINKNGKKLEEIELEKSVFDQKSNDGLLAQYLHVYKSNQRQGTSATKTRAEVSGGGKKPWRQKGTGRARHGSIRSPIWVGGGIAHGPQPKSWKLKFPKRMKKRAMQCALSFKANEEKIKVLNELSVSKPSTKDMVKVLNDLEMLGKTLIILAKNDQSLVKSTSNLKGVEIAEVQNLNVYQVLNNDNMLIEKEAVESLQKKYK